VKGPCSHCVEKDEKVGNPCSIARCKLCHEGIRVQGREEGSWVLMAWLVDNVTIDVRQWTLTFKM
jgi:hypothetical protein